MNMPAELKVAPELVERIACAFIRDEVHRIGLEKVVLGLSGGIDSALSCYLAVRALGAENVIPILMPSEISNPESTEHALLCVDDLKLPVHHLIKVSPQVETYFDKPEVPKSADERQMKTRIGNKMARERMTILYDFSVVEQALVLGTSNKSEILLGYSTIFGDNASAINPIGDMYKMQVFQMSEYLGIPEPVRLKKPSADLWQGQTDEDDLGFTYYDVDRLLYLMVDRRRTNADLVAAGFDERFVTRVRQMVQVNQFKRRPPLICKLSERTIDRDFNYARDWGT